MRFTETNLAGAYIIDIERMEDDRGFFARTSCSREFDQHDLVGNFVQCSISWNPRKGTVRGLHYQLPPAGEVKLVRCTRGSILDVVVDLRPESPTYLAHVEVELTARNHRALYVPRSFAHGLQVLEDDTEVLYQISEYHAPEIARGLRYDDPKLSVKWPLPVTVISERDRNWPLLPTSASKRVLLPQEPT